MQSKNLAIAIWQQCCTPAALSAESLNDFSSARNVTETMADGISNARPTADPSGVTLESAASGKKVRVRQVGLPFLLQTHHALRSESCQRTPILGRYLGEFKFFLIFKVLSDAFRPIRLPQKTTSLLPRENH